MPPAFDILILRDPRESVRRCSLTPLRSLDAVRFVSWRPEFELDAGDRLLLHPDGDLLTPAHAGHGLLLVDCSWRRLDVLLRAVRGDPPRLRLPGLRTAYPRRSRSFADPDGGLASIEALYAATHVLGRPWPELLEGYRWADEFLQANPGLALPPARP